MPPVSICPLNLHSAACTQHVGKPEKQTAAVHCGLAARLHLFGSYLVLSNRKESVTKQDVIAKEQSQIIFLSCAVLNGGIDFETFSSDASSTRPGRPAFPTHCWMEFIMAWNQLSRAVWRVIPSLPVSSGFCSVIESQTYPFSPRRQFLSFGSRDGTSIVWQWTNSSDEQSVCFESSPPFCRGRS